MSRRVVIVGGGIAGLAAAHRFVEHDPSTQVTLLEASARVGGLLRTDRIEGFLIEVGPDSFLTQASGVLGLARRLGIEDEILPTRASRRGVYVVRDGRLVRIPEGFNVLAPAKIAPFLRSPIVSWGGKVRALADLALPRSRAQPQDESLASFVRRRLGDEVYERLAQPMASGIYGAPGEQISLRSTLPRFAELEDAHRSLILGLRRQREHASASGARYGMMASFRGGMQTLPDALASRLDGRIRCNCPVVDVRRSDRVWTVSLQDGARIEADALLLALRTPVASRLLRNVDCDLSESLAEIDWSAAAMVTLAWRIPEIPHPLDAFGFVVPRIERRRILASTWASVKYEGRAPEGYALLRVFFGHGEATDLDDDALVRLARSELAALLGVCAEPVVSHVSRQLEAMPRYAPGHLARVSQIEARLSAIPGLALTGSGYRGVGIPSVVSHAEQVAESLMETCRP